MSEAPAGWYPDGAGSLRYWDGSAWTEHTQPAEPVPAIDAAHAGAPSSYAVDEVPAARRPFLRRPEVLIAGGVALALVVGALAVTITRVGESSPATAGPVAAPVVTMAPPSVPAGGGLGQWSAVTDEGVRVIATIGATAVDEPLIGQAEQVRSSNGKPPAQWLLLSIDATNSASDADSGQVTIVAGDGTLPKIDSAVDLMNRLSAEVPSSTDTAISTVNSLLADKQGGSIPAGARATVIDWINPTVASVKSVTVTIDSEEVPLSYGSTPSAAPTASFAAGSPKSTAAALAGAAGCTSYAAEVVEKESKSLGAIEEGSCKLNGTKVGVVVFKDSASTQVGVSLIKGFASLLPAGTYYLALGSNWFAYSDETYTKTAAEAFANANRAKVESFQSSGS